MKKNLGLFLVFVVLLGLTYFLQEKRVETEKNEARVEGQLIPFEVTSLKLPNVEGIKKEGRWFTPDGKLLSHNTLKQVEKKLTEIKKVKDIKGEWENFFPNPFIFEINGSKWTIGDLSLDKQAFYIAHDDKIYLAVIEGESIELTRDESAIAAIKLNELVSLLSRKKTEYLENQLFRFYEDLPLKKVVLNLEDSLPFELNFDDNTTLPPPIQGIDVHKDLLGKFYSLLTQVTIKEELSFKDVMGFKKLASIEFLNDKKNIRWELWLKNKTSADALIIDPVTQRVFSVIGGTLKIYFVRIQDYWDKKVIPPEDFVSFTRLPVTFIQGEKKAEVVILNREPLSFEAKGFKVQGPQMEFLMQFVFNLASKDQAQRVSNLSTSEKKMLLSNEHLRMEVMEQELVMWRKEQELIVVNLTQGFKAHFNLVDENFHARFEDVLK